LFLLFVLETCSLICAEALAVSGSCRETKLGRLLDAALLTNRFLVQIDLATVAATAALQSYRKAPNTSHRPGRVTLVIIGLAESLSLGLLRRSAANCVVGCRPTI
jgi:hypothetical protein